MPPGDKIECEACGHDGFGSIRYKKTWRKRERLRTTCLRCQKRAEFPAGTIRAERMPEPYYTAYTLRWVA